MQPTCSRSFGPARHAARFRRPAAQAVLAMTMAIVVSPPTVASAQALAPVAAQHVSPPPADTLTGFNHSPTHNSPAIDFGARIGIGAAATFAGAFVGGLASVAATAGCHGEFCALERVVFGAAAGSVLASGITSALPEMSSACGLGRRVGSGILGSLSGAVIGGMLGQAVGGGGILLGFLAGSGVGGGVGSALCR